MDGSRTRERSFQLHFQTRREIPYRFHCEPFLFCTGCRECCTTRYSLSLNKNAINCFFIIIIEIPSLAELLQTIGKFYLEYYSYPKEPLLLFVVLDEFQAIPLAKLNVLIGRLTYAMIQLQSYPVRLIPLLVGTHTTAGIEAISASSVPACSLLITPFMEGS